MATVYDLVITLARSIRFRPPHRLSFRPRSTPYVVPTMPQKRAVSSGKRKAESDSDDGEQPVGSKPQTKTKKAKVAAPTAAGASNPAEQHDGLAPNGQPTNKVLPVKISFPPRAEGATRIASWNICGLASSQKKVR